MKHYPLVKPLPAFLFAIAIGGLIVFSIPTNFELARLSQASFQQDSAETYLRNIVADNPSKASVLRHLSDTLELQGDLPEAIKIAHQLVELKPKNKEYHERLIRLLSWDGQTLEATRAKEAMATLSTPDRAQLMEIARDYEWLNSPTDLYRVYQLLISERLYTNEDVEPIIRHLLKGEHFDQVNAFIADVQNYLTLEDKTYLSLFNAYTAMQIPSKAVLIGAIYLGAPESVRPWESTEFFLALDPSALRKNAPFVKDLIWSYRTNHDKEIVFPIYQALINAGSIEPAQRLEYVDRLIEQKHTVAAKEAIWDMADRLTTSEELWRDYSKRFIWMGQPATAASILESLLKHTTPKPNKEETGLLTEWSYTLADTNTLPPITTPLAQSNQDRIRAYELLIEAYSNSNQPDKVIETIDRLLLEYKNNALQLSNKEHCNFRETLAERYSWKSDPESVLSTLEPLESEELSGHGRILQLFAHDDLGHQENVKKLLFSLQVSDSDGLEQSMKDRLHAMRMERSYIYRDRFLASTGESLNFKASYVDELRDKPSLFSASSGLSHTASQGLNTLIGSSLRQPLLTDISILLNAEFDHMQRSGRTYGRALTGLRLQTSSGVIEVAGGWLAGKQYFSPQAQASVGGSILGLNFASLTIELARPLTQSVDFSNLGVSESRLEVYFETRLSNYFELRGSFLGRLSHLGNRLAQGEGLDINLRSGYSKPDGHLQFGPWFNLVQWSSKNTTLTNLFTKAYTIVGAYGQWDWGGGRPFAWKGSLALGIGYNLATVSPEKDIFFVETQMEKLVYKEFGIRFDYALYSARAEQTTSAATHIFNISGFWEI